MSAETKGEIRTCPNDGEPVIFTLENPGHEYVCTVCGWVGGVLGTPRSLATDALVNRHRELLDAFNEARGIRPERPLPTVPKCQGCGADAPSPHKPPHWFTRTPCGDGEPIYACSRSCIKDDAMVLPW